MAAARMSNEASVDATNPSVIPDKLRCRTCHGLAVNAFRLPCCEESICEGCQAILTNACPLCSHEPLLCVDCRPNKALRNTIKAFLRSEEKKREKAEPSHEPSLAAQSLLVETIADHSAPHSVETNAEETEEHDAEDTLEAASVNSDSSVEIIVDSEQTRSRGPTRESLQSASSHQEKSLPATRRSLMQTQSSTQNNPPVAMNPLFPMMAMQHTMSPFAFNPMMLMNSQMDPQMMMMAQMSQGMFGNFGQGFGMMNGMGMNLNGRSPHWGMNSMSGPNAGPYPKSGYRSRSHQDHVGQMQNPHFPVSERNRNTPSDHLHRTLQNTTAQATNNGSESECALSTDTATYPQDHDPTGVNDAGNSATKAKLDGKANVSGDARNTDNGPADPLNVASDAVASQHDQPATYSRETRADQHTFFQPHTQSYNAYEQPKQRGRPLRGTRDAFSATVARTSFGNNPGQTAAPTGQGVVGAPTGPRAMREGRSRPGVWSRGSLSAAGRGLHVPQSHVSEEQDTHFSSDSIPILDSSRSASDPSLLNVPFQRSKGYSGVAQVQKDSNMHDASEQLDKSLLHADGASLQGDAAHACDSPKSPRHEGKRYHHSSHRPRERSRESSRDEQHRGQDSRSSAAEKNSYEEERSHYRREREKRRSGRERDRSRPRGSGKEHKQERVGHRDRHARKERRRSITRDKGTDSSNHAESRAENEILDGTHGASHEFKIHGQSQRNQGLSQPTQSEGDPYALEREARKREREIKELQRRVSHHHSSALESGTRKRSRAEGDGDDVEAATSGRKKHRRTKERRQDWDEERLARNENEREAARWNS